MTECHCGKCERLEEKRCTLKLRVSRLEDIVKDFLGPHTQFSAAEAPGLLQAQWVSYQKEFNLDS
jgi:hypothetical protein